jgi:hypothetical protein
MMGSVSQVPWTIYLTSEVIASMSSSKVGPRGLIESGAYITEQKLINKKHLLSGQRCFWRCATSRSTLFMMLRSKAETGGMPSPPWSTGSSFEI